MPLFTFSFENSIEFRAGDEVKTTCVFKTTSRSKTVFVGDGTSDEMCYGFLTFHPAENVRSPYCIQYNTIDTSELWFKSEIQNCRFNDFMNTTHPDTQRLHQRVLSHCSLLSECLKECQQVVEEVRQHPCMQGDIHEWIRGQVRDDITKHAVLAQFFSATDSCNTEMALKSCPKPRDPLNGSSSIYPFTLLLVVLLMFVLHI